MKRSHLFSLVTVLGLAGCVDTRNPIVTVRSAGNAILENNLKDYQATLSKSIREEWGTQAKLDELKAILSTHAKLEVSHAVLTHVEQGEQGWGYWGDVLRLFDVELLDKTTGALVIKTEVKCVVWVSQTSNPNGNCPPAQPNCNGQFQYIENQDCRLTKIIE